MNLLTLGAGSVGSEIVTQESTSSVAPVAKLHHRTLRSSSIHLMQPATHFVLHQPDLCESCHELPQGRKTFSFLDLSVVALFDVDDVVAVVLQDL